ncbi:MAG: hypothetical protein ACKO23_14695 [Gemmataceae bacterium]
MNPVAPILLYPMFLFLAPVPAIRPLENTEEAIRQFRLVIRHSPSEALVARKKHLMNRLRELQKLQERQGKAVEANTTRERLLVVESIGTDGTLGDAPTAEILHKASLGGKYRYLAHVLPAPGDRAQYAELTDFGHWKGTTYNQFQDLQPGFWVYSQSRWFIWREGPNQP